jgi:two-component sensor histidine kinase
LCGTLRQGDQERVHLLSNVIRPGNRRIRAPNHLELMILQIEDDGAGMPSNRREGSLGLKLIEMFARQINGKARMEGKPGGEGTIVVVTFPVLNTSAR